MTRTYVDFDLLIQRSGKAYRSRVLDSPAGNAGEDFVLPFQPLRLENFILRIGRSLGEWRRDVRRLETSERGQIREFGTELFEAVFKDSVLSALRASIDRAGAKDAGVRIRLRLTDVPELASIPWEYLYNPTTNQFLCLTVDTPIVRYLDLPYGARPLSVTPPLRVLVMVSSPEGVPPLDVATEVARLESEDALGELIANGLVEFHVLDRATLSALTGPLRTGRFHIFHFIGHGGFDESAQDGALLLEDDQKKRRLVTGQDLGVMLNGHRSLRLAVLNACEGARAATDDPFAGVATSLLQQGVPAVIAMQFEITDRAAITFAHEFYGAVADGYPIDAAVTEARRAIFAQSNEVEWATPVLYLRAPTGRIFRINPRPREPADRVDDDRIAPVVPIGSAEPAEADPSEAERTDAEEAARRREAEEWAAEEAAREELARAERDRAARARAQRQEAERREAEELARRQRESAERERLRREVEEREAERRAALQRRRRHTVTGLVAAVLVVAIVAVILVLRPDPGPDLAEVPPNSLFAYGPDLAEVQDEIPGVEAEVVGREMRARNGDIWVAGDTAVVHANRASNEVVPISIDPPLSDFAFDAQGEVWVVHAGRLSEINSQTNDPPVSTPLDSVPIEITLRGGYVWVLARSDGADAPDVVLRLDVEGGSPRGEVRVDGIDIGANDAAVWVADRAGSQIHKVSIGTDQVDPEVIESIDLEHPPDGIVADPNFVYAFNTDLGTITVVDDQLIELSDPIEIDHRPIAITAGLDHAWTLNDDGTITRFDPITRAPETFTPPVPIRVMTVDNDQRLIWAIADQTQ
jgi:CHAT domain